MQERYGPYERPEPPLDPPEPQIPPDVSGWYNRRDDEFVPDDLAFEAALEDWDLMPRNRREEFKEILINLFYQDWERIEPE